MRQGITVYWKGQSLVLRTVFPAGADLLTERSGFMLITLIASASVSTIALPVQGLSAEVAQEKSREGIRMMQSEPGEGIDDLPYSHGKRFRTLDAYLAHLQRLGAIDLPWWREIRPNVYELVVHMRGARRETATREELMRRYGFSR